MSLKNFRSQSRDVQWAHDADKTSSLEQINCGSLLRIADAAEKMALRFTELIDANKRLQNHVDQLRKLAEVRRRQTGAAKGQITKLKKKLTATQEQKP